ncbi:RDD family protein [Sphingomonas qomolangmaensis]|uniref:RDD family protein n=1 Tax=Sphingomonas qomolangmaensis TaxID=2918765 RepID=A0ABY5LDN5_9SPHN|nr:RDD family protein [Sphingomonas qomolangmaensis]UUL83955.1 RDD family protein [Sphingomonas qomolangmaensis]
MAKAKRIGLERRLVTPEGVTLQLKLAGSGARAGAFLIDALVMLAILIGTTLALFAFHAGLGSAFGSLLLILWMLGFFALRNFYFILSESGARAATLGKRVMRLRVIARDGGRLTGGAIVARNLMREIEIFLPLMFTAYSASQGIGDRWAGAAGLLWAAIFLFFPAFNRDRLRAGDLIAGTWVIETQRRRIGTDLLAAAPIAATTPFSDAELDAYGQYELQKLEEVLRRDDRDSITTVAAAIRRRIGRDDMPDDRQFLDAYYAAVRLHLERKLLFGQRKRDKFDAAA